MGLKDKFVSGLTDKLLEYNPKIKFEEREIKFAGFKSKILYWSLWNRDKQIEDTILSISYDKDLLSEKVKVKTDYSYISQLLIEYYKTFNEENGKSLGFIIENKKFIQ